MLAKLVGDASCSVTAAVRASHPQLEVDVDTVDIGEINGHTDWSDALKGVDIIVHAAGRAHRVYSSPKDDLESYRTVNTAASLNLARQAQTNGVGRFVFLSSIGVLGNVSRHPLREEDQPRPQSAYAVSKLEAEAGLQTIAAENDLDVVIIRPPLVYGPGAPGNFARLVNLVKRGFPLPLKAIKNRRSLVGLDNLVDFVCLCMFHPAAANQIFHVSDDSDVSTPELVNLIAAAMGKSARLFSVPRPLLVAGAGLTGRKRTFESLCGNLQVDISRARRLLGWLPPCSLTSGIERAVGYTWTRPQA